MTTTLQELYKCVLDGDISNVSQMVQETLNSGESSEKILNESLISAMSEVGRLFEEGEYFVPEMLISAKTMQTALEILRPLLAEAEIEPQGIIVIGTVKGDLHDIGKNLVAMMLEGAGFEVIDLGVDVSPEQFVEALTEHHASILAMSALLTTTMPQMEKTIKAVRSDEHVKSVKVLVGGAPVTNDYAEQISADGFAPDASQAAKLALSFTK